MSSYTQILYHLVFSTKKRAPSLSKPNRERFFRYIWGITKERRCHLYRINCVDDHVHMLTDLHPTLSLSNYVKDIKAISSIWIKNDNIFPEFTAWQEGYGAFTHAIYEKSKICTYIANQEEHHKTMTFKEEFIALLREATVKGQPGG